MLDAAHIKVNPFTSRTSILLAPFDIEPNVNTIFTMIDTRDRLPFPGARAIASRMVRTHQQREPDAN